MEWIRQVQDLGAGELLINSIDADGTRNGFDLELIELVRTISTVPVIASGGAGAVEHFIAAANAGADALLAASVFHEGLFTVADVKSALAKSVVEVR
jgi:cyclase